MGIHVLYVKGGFMALFWMFLPKKAKITRNLMA
jgi:hypothetical protein